MLYWVMKMATEKQGSGERVIPKFYRTDIFRLGVEKRWKPDEVIQIKRMTRYAGVTRKEITITKLPQTRILPFTSLYCAECHVRNK